jgi:hypothetical protein
MKRNCKNLDEGDSGNDSRCKLSWGGELCDSLENPENCEDYEEDKSRSIKDLHPCHPDSR